MILGYINKTDLTCSELRNEQGRLSNWAHNEISACAFQRVWEHECVWLSDWLSQCVGGKVRVCDSESGMCSSGCTCVWSSESDRWAQMTMYQNVSASTSVWMRFRTVCECTRLPGRSSGVFIPTSRTLLTAANPVKTCSTIPDKHQHTHKYNLKSLTLSHIFYSACLCLTCIARSQLNSHAPLMN